MHKVQYLNAKNLRLDENNYRTTHQKNENDALKSMVSIHPDRFWGLVDGILKNGYIPSENIIVLKQRGALVVKEGNRRVAALKLILGELKLEDGLMPQSVSKTIGSLGKDWIKENSTIPCSVYEESEIDEVKNIVSLIHGKNRKDSRFDWPSVARARHNKDEGKIENGLDLLEKYLINGKNASEEQKQRWAGIFNLTVLDELIKLSYSYFGFSDKRSMVLGYPNVEKIEELDDLIYKIGQQEIGFNEIRQQFDKKLIASIDKTKLVKVNEFESQRATKTASRAVAPEANSQSQDTNTPSSAETNITQIPSGKKATRQASFKALEDPASVTQYFKAMRIVGNNREKAETIRREIIHLDIKVTPLAFTFLLRSFLEIMTKTYIQSRPEMSIDLVNGGQDKPLINVLREISQIVAPSANNMTNGPAKDAAKVKNRDWHGVMQTLSNPTSVLSITSMNILIHNPLFSARAEVFSSQFHNLRPLIDELNTIPATN